MEFNVNDKLHGFTVGRVRKLKDCEGTLIEMKHDQTDCDLIYMNRKDENATFAIAFKTIPADDTGVFHILEHSVLNGSRKYPVKEPFVELLKSSLQTFLNAMTYPDKTMYPISSRNEKDFLNLMDVYLDAVFYPQIYENKNIFLQEGWHYELKDEKDELKYSGVVHSEMKGAYSNVNEVMSNVLNKMIYPDTCYQHESGGDPNFIPELTYEQFIETHRTYYHPSNATVILDGEMNVDVVLEKIDEYLSGFERKEGFEIPMQKPVLRKDETCYYAIEQDEDETNKTHIAFGKIGGTYRDVEKMVAWDAIADVLVGSNEAPLKKAILEKEYGQDVELDMSPGIQQPMITLVVRNTEAKYLEPIRQLIQEVMIDIIDQGLDAEKLIASLNMMEFKYREKSEPAGVINASSILTSTLYGGDPTIYIDRGDVYATLREKAKKGNYFTSLLKEFFLDHEHICSLTAIPSKTLEKEEKEKEQKKLQDEKKKLNLKDVIKENHELLAWQEATDSKEALDKLPKLTKEDVSLEPRGYEAEVVEKENVPVLVYPEQTKGIVYFSLYFNLAGLNIEQLPSIALFTSLLADLSTKQHSIEELSQEIRANIGSLTITNTVSSVFNNRGLAVPMLEINCAVLKEDLEKAVSIIQEILLETNFNKEEIKPLLSQYVETARQALIGSGHAVALNTVAAQYSSAGAALEYISGFKSMKWLYEFDKNYEERIENFIIDCELYRNVIFTSSRLTVSVTEEENYQALEGFIHQLPTGSFERSAVRYPAAPKRNVGILIPAQVSYSARAAFVDKEKFDASSLVLAHILTYEYLWNEIRVKQGVYGTGFTAGNTNVISAYSYRDPRPNKTVETVKNIQPFMEDFLQKHSDLTSYIIGVIASQEPLLSPRGMLRSANMRYFAGLNYDLRKEMRREILEADANVIKEDVKRFHDALENGTYCIVGNEEALKQSNIEKENILKFEE
ncbi:MAG: insulinase family protein [Solobacterium sp.]|nr:insulinase family protein [Solobacterium sp.]